ncbi:TMEM165/GDT1 family protein [Vallitalea pronyensis]|uniref:GDT1 family protein n=1 Tax=Vallitalea pronyensis TaxID=1348613 RepID=A0A8J8SIL9_9FIRM|nr:TMEM165/GDT1 family protein [Vallitalea pronyensis]QUI24582.1 TMEM165/GDT1 family protein [Vallitalea pronyensis]
MMLVEFIQAFGLIFIAEMGDKTQILAMAFATKYSVKAVLVGIGLGSLFNHGLAVVLGSYLSNFIPISTIQMVAGFAFVAFALWTLQMEEDHKEEKKMKKSFGPIMTIALAFFIGELGDKTQLTAITLSVDAAYPAIILMGTVIGMLVTGGLGIYVGRKIGDKVPELTIKLVAASIFMFFGLTKLYGTVPKQYVNSIYGIVFIILIGVIATVRVKKLWKMHKSLNASKYVGTSKRLQEYYQMMDQDIKNICLGNRYCGDCQRSGCVVGRTKALIKQMEDWDQHILVYEDKKLEVLRDAKKERVLEALVTTLRILSNEQIKHKELKTIHQIRQNFEKILWGTSIDVFTSLRAYREQVKAIAPELVCSLDTMLEDT